MIFLFILISALTLVLTFLAHYLVFFTAAKLFGLTAPAYLNAVRAASVILPLSFILSIILISRFANLLVRSFYTITAAWMGFLLYLFLACVLFYAILFLGKISSFAVNQKILAIVLFLVAAAAGIYGIFAADNIKIKNLDIALPNLPEEWRGKTAVFISDLHLGAINNYEFASRVAKQVDDLRPDLLFIGGDLFDGQKNVDLKRLAQTFGAVNAPRGKFFITGNHEEFGDNSIFINAVTDSGIKYLNNEMVEISGLQIIGADYAGAYSKSDFTAALKKLNINKNLPSILLRHVPDKIDVAPEFGISLELCGHAHKGQLFPIQFIETLFYDGYQYGLKKSGVTAVYTSSGVGVWGPPMRVLADPEIVRIKFE